MPLKRYFVTVPKRRRAQNSLQNKGSTWVGREVRGMRGTHRQEAFIVASAGKAWQSRESRVRII